MSECISLYKVQLYMYMYYVLPRDVIIDNISVRKCTY
jgi:hypothetical protein